MIVKCSMWPQRAQTMTIWPWRTWLATASRWPKAWSSCPPARWNYNYLEICVYACKHPTLGIIIALCMWMWMSFCLLRSVSTEIWQPETSCSQRTMWWRSATLASLEMSTKTLTTSAREMWVRQTDTQMINHALESSVREWNLHHPATGTSPSEVDGSWDHLRSGVHHTKWCLVLWGPSLGDLFTG